MSNKIYVNNKIDKNFIDMCDKEFDKKLSLAAGAVFTGKEKIIGLSGPTCSGKTTAASMLSKRLFLDGRKIHVISIDDFYFDRDFLDVLSKSKGLDAIDYD